MRDTFAMRSLGSTRGTQRTVARGMLLLLIAAASPAQAQELGRLFFSPERRAALDRARQFNVQSQQQVAEGNTLALSGLVQRSSGKRTVWVNGVPIHENSVTDVRVVGVAPRGAVSLIPGDQTLTRITVGTAVNRSTGERQDALNGGSVKVRPSPGPASAP